MPRPAPALIVLLLALAGLTARADSGHPGADMAGAASVWLQSLPDPLRAKAVFPLGHDERENWHFVPQARRGLPLKEMTAAQRSLARELVAAGLNQRALLQTDAIIALEDVLFAMEGTARRDGGLYYFSVFGTPSPHGTWGWRIEGHHLSVNFTLVDGEKISATPMFFGSNPAEVRIAHVQKGRRALAAEEDLGRSLVTSFNAGQRQIVLIASQAPNDIVTGNDRQVKLGAPAGLAQTQMTPEQQARLRALVDVYIGRLRPELAIVERQKIADRGWDKVHFAWAGGLEKGDAHYYRIQGPAFVIEYDNTQNGANHIHTTWRSFEGDFGRDLLRDHYTREHSPR